MWGDEPMRIPQHPPLNSTPLNPTALQLSKQVVGFDLVDDESKPERRPNKHMPSPSLWDSKHNPAYAYYAYYM